MKRFFLFTFRSSESPELFNGITNIKYSASSCRKFCNCSAGKFENLFLLPGRTNFFRPCYSCPGEVDTRVLIRTCAFVCMSDCSYFEFHVRYKNCVSEIQSAIDNDVDTNDFWLVLGIFHICGHAHVRSHVSPDMDWRLRQKLHN